MRSALEEVKGVEKVDVNFDAKEACVKAKADVTEDSLIKAVEKAGYKATVKKDDEKKPEEKK